METIQKRTFPISFLNKYRWLIHGSAVGFYLLVTIGVLYTCFNVTYPYLFTRDEIVVNSLYLIFVLFNMMGNFLLGTFTKSFFKTGVILPEPPRSWLFCTKCNQHAPPRSHHCIVCQVCVLKQDHHCFFLCQCVGVHNQKYFIPYTLYVALGSFHAIRCILTYLNLTYVPIQLSFYTIFSYFIPGPLVNWFLGYGNINLDTVICILVLYGCFSTSFGCLFLFFGEMFIVARGQTPYEFLKGVGRYNRGVLTNLKGVFGKWWILNFLIPFPNKAKDTKSPWGIPSYYKSV